MCCEHRMTRTGDSERGSDIEKNHPVKKRNDQEDVFYYGMPSLKHSHYHWKTALSFLAEALGGAPQIIAALVRYFGTRQDHNLVRAGRYLALASSFLSPALLISELHTPRRWFNMLRIFRPTSAMCIGNMSLTAFGFCSGMTAIGQMLEDLGNPVMGRRMSDVFSLPAAATGGMICLYPGTELEGTCSPLWSASHPMLSPMIAATGFSCGTAAMNIAAQVLTVSDHGRDRLNDFSIMTLGVQFASAILTESTWRASAAGRFYTGSPQALAYRIGVAVGIVFPLALHIGGRYARKRLSHCEIAASAATIAGGFLLYNSVLEAGNQSAVNPAAYLEQEQSAELPSEEGSTSFRSRRRWRRISLALFTGAGLALILKRRSHR